VMYDHLYEVRFGIVEGCVQRSILIAYICLFVAAYSACA
jgi:hypothetical protein